MEEEARWPKQLLVKLTPIGDHCIVFVLPWCLLTQMYKWVLVTEQWGQGAAEITSIDGFLIFFLKHPFLMHQSLKRALISHMYIFVYTQEFGFYLLFRA